MQVEFGTLSAAELREAAALLARAFEGDGVISHYLAGARRRRIAAPALFRSVLHVHMPYGTVHAARDRGRLAGVAIWAPPVPPPVPARARARSALELLEVRALFPAGARPLFEGLDRLSAMHPAEPHWYLAFMGVASSHRKAGVGSELLAPALAQADAVGAPCHLETPFPETHAFYERLGFRVVGTVDVFPGARPMTLMNRRPSVDH